MTAELSCPGEMSTRSTAAILIAIALPAVARLTVRPALNAALPALEKTKAVAFSLDWVLIAVEN